MAVFGASVERSRSEVLSERFRALRGTKFYDLFAAIPVICWYLYCAAQQFATVMPQIMLAKLIAQTDAAALSVVLLARIAANLTALGFIVLLILLLAVRRIPIARSSGVYPRVVAIAGTFLGLGIVQLPPQELSATAYLVSLLLIVSGTAFAIFALAALGRSMSIFAEARGLVTSGPYGTIRHPLYLGELLAITGISLQYFSVWALLLLLLQCICQFERIRNEERILLRVFPQYRDYVAGTARLLPHVY